MNMDDKKIIIFKRDNGQELWCHVNGADMTIALYMNISKSVGTVKFVILEKTIVLNNILIEDEYQGDGIGYICVWLLANYGKKKDKKIVRVSSGGGNGKVKGCEMYKIWAKYGLTVPEVERATAVELYSHQIKQNLEEPQHRNLNNDPFCIETGGGIVCETEEIEKIGLYNYEGGIETVYEACYDGFEKKQWHIQNSF